MKVLITGANSFMGRRLLAVLLEKGHDVFCLIRDKLHFKDNHGHSDKLKFITGDLLREQSMEAFPLDIDIAYYLINSKLHENEFSQLTALSAHNFVQALDKTNCKQIIFLSRGIKGNKRAEYLQQYAGCILNGAKATLTLCATIPDWYLIWPFYHFMFKGIANQTLSFEHDVLMD